MSSIPVVNEKDEIIGSKEREQITFDDIYRVAALCVVDEQGRMLLARRGWKKTHDLGKWGPAVAGTVERGETYEANIIKEAEEELGLTNLKLKTEWKNFRNEPRKWKFFCQWYSTTIPAETKLTFQEKEIAEVKWFTRHELSEQLKHDQGQFLTSVVDLMSRFMKPV